jgi:hypothetical protein
MTSLSFVEHMAGFVSLDETDYNQAWLDRQAQRPRVLVRPHARGRRHRPLRRRPGPCRRLDPETHHWTSRELGYAPLRFLKQIRASVLAGHLVNVDGLGALPEDYLEGGPPKNQRWTFVAGSKNQLFLAGSQRRTFKWFDDAQPDVHAHHLFEGYGHLDLAVRDRRARERVPNDRHGARRPIGSPQDRRGGPQAARNELRGVRGLADERLRVPLREDPGHQHDY